MSHVDKLAEHIEESDHEIREAILEFLHQNNLVIAARTYEEVNHIPGVGTFRQTKERS